jgi:hypothetical protein
MTTNIFMEIGFREMGSFINEFLIKMRFLEPRPPLSQHLGTPSSQIMTIITELPLYDTQCNTQQNLMNFGMKILKF